MKCPDCGSIQLRLNPDKGETYCDNCGYVIEDYLPERHEILPEGRIAHAPGDIKAGSYIPNGRIVKAAWFFNRKEKNVISAKKKIGFIGSKLHLQDYVCSDAASLYKEAVYKDLNVGRDNSSLMHACLYIACKLHQRPITPKEILEYALNTNQKDMLNAARLVKEELNIPLKPCDPADYVYKYAGELQVSPQTTTKIVELVGRIKKTNLFEGRHPESVIAAAIYLGCKLNKEPRSQREISAVVGVIEITIRKRFREIELKLKLN